MRPRKGLVPVLGYFVVLTVAWLTLSYLAVVWAGLVTVDELFSNKLALGTWGFWAGTLILVAVLAALLLGKLLGSVAALPVGQAGILVVLGERSDAHVLREGWYWIPPLSSVLSFNSREQQLSLPVSEVLSADNVPIRFQGQVQVRITDPYRYSDVVDAEATLRQQALDACRVQISTHSALAVALDGRLADAITARVAARAQEWGLTVASVALTELRLPEEVERYAQVIRLILQQNPDLSATRVLDALQADRGRIRKVVFESHSIDAAAAAMVGALFGRH